MEWLVPVLFVVASLAQWYMQRNRQGQKDETLSPREKARSAPTRHDSPPQEEFGDLGDLLEALGRRRHESPPPIVEQAAPPVLPDPRHKASSLPQKRTSPSPSPEPVLVPAAPPSVAAPLFPGFPDFQSTQMTGEASRMERRTFPVQERAGTFSAHRWAEKLRSPATIRDAVILSEILAPPLSLR